MVRMGVVGRVVRARERREVCCGVARPLAISFVKDIELESGRTRILEDTFVVGLVAGRLRGLDLLGF